MRKQRVSGEKGSRESGARASSPATTCLAKGCGTGILPVFHGFIFFDMIDMIDMIWRASVTTRRRDGQWRASVPTSRLPLCGRMVSGSIAEHREGRASARPRASRRLPLPAAVTPPASKPLRLRVSALKKRSTLNALRAGTPALPTASIKTSASLRLCVKKTLNALRAGTPALPTTPTKTSASLR